MQYRDRERLEASLVAVRTRRRSVHPSKVDRVLRLAGFVRRSGKGDHRIYLHLQRPRLVTIDPRSPLLPAYVSDVIAAVEEILNAEDAAG